MSRAIADAMLKRSAKKWIQEIRVSSGQRLNYTHIFSLVLFVEETYICAVSREIFQLLAKEIFLEITSNCQNCVTSSNHILCYVMVLIKHPNFGEKFL